MKPDDGLGLESSVIPVLSKVPARLDAGTSTWAVLMSVCRPGPEGPYVAVASRSTSPDVRPEEGAVTVKVADADRPGATVPTPVAPDGATVQPDGTVSASVAAVSGRDAGLVRVSRTVNELVASVVEGTAASVGAGLAGGP